MALNKKFVVITTHFTEANRVSVTYVSDYASALDTKARMLATFTCDVAIAPVAHITYGKREGGAFGAQFNDYGLIEFVK